MFKGLNSQKKLYYDFVVYIFIINNYYLKND